MKNLFLSLAFMLLSSFAFANNSCTFDLSQFQKNSFETYATAEMQSIQDLFGTCTVPIAAYDEFGDKIKT